MTSLRLPAIFMFVLFTFSACTQTGGSDVRNEIGANGLPTPRAIFARYVDAIGGEDVIRSHSSTTSTGSFSLAAFGLSGDIVMYQAAPNLMSQNIELGGLGSISSGYNGEVGWAVDPLQGPIVLEGDALTDLIDQADYFAPLNLQLSANAQTLEQTSLGQSQVYQVRFDNTRGAEVVMYFDVDSSLMVGMDSEAASPIGPVQTVTRMSEYRDFGGYRMPTRIVVDQAGQEVLVEIDSVSFDNVSADAFTPPASVQSQLR